MSLDQFIKLFESKTKRSREIYEEVREVLPSGVASHSLFMEPYPLYVDKAFGSKMIEVDGKVVNH